MIESAEISKSLYARYEAMIAERDAKSRTFRPVAAGAMDWHLVTTAPNGEWYAAEALMRRGFDVFVPTITLKRRLRGRTAERQAMLFPSYLFVAQPHGAAFFVEIERAPRVIAIVQSDGNPALLPQRVIEHLCAALAGGCFRHDFRRDCLRYVAPGTAQEDLIKFRVGDPVKVLDPRLFDCVMAEIAAAPAHERIDVFMRMFCGKVRVSVSLACVESLT